MKKLLTFLVASGLSALSWSAVVTPQDQHGGSLYTTDFVGAIPCDIDNSTGTAAIICNSTGTNGVAIGPGIVYGVITSSIAQSDFLIFKDTTGIGNISGYLAPQSTLTTLTLTTIAVIGNGYQNLLSSSSFMPTFPQTNLIKFPVPLLFKSGILVQLNAAPLSNQGVSRWTILWRPLYTTQSPYGN